LDLDLLFNSIKTLKSVDALKQLLTHPRPDVNEQARLCAKISYFKKHLTELNLPVPNHLEAAQKAEKVTNAFQVS